MKIGQWGMTWQSDCRALYTIRLKLSDDKCQPIDFAITSDMAYVNSTGA